MKRILSSILVIAMLFTLLPVSFAADYDYIIKTGASTYDAKVGDVIDVPVYLYPTATETTTVQCVEAHITIPEGLTATITGGAITSGFNVNGNEVVIASDMATVLSAATPVITIQYTATAAGTYNIEFVGDIILLDSGYGDIIGTFGKEGATITVAGGVTPPPAPTLVDIAVNAPSVITVPYGADAVETVKAAITGVTAIYDDDTTAAVDDYTVTVDGDVATIAYEGISKTIAVEYAEPPVVDVEIIVAVNAIVVPYNITVPADVYAKSQVGEVKVKNSKGEERVVEAQITYDEAASAVVVEYGELAPVTIPVTVITLVDYTISGITGVIEIPYDCEDAAAYVKGLLTVIGNLSDGNTIAVDFTVEVNEDWTAAYVKVNGEQIEVVDTKKGEEPVAAIVGIKLEVADAIVVPYGTEDVAAYIASKIVVKTVDENGEEAAISDYTLAVNDGYADIAYGEFAESVDFTVETAKLVASVETIEIPYTVDAADYAAYIAANVGLVIDYSANTADKAVVATAADVQIDADVAVITIEGLTATVAYTVQATPEYFATAVPAYDLEGKVLVKITGVADGKVAVVNGLYATYFGNGAFAAVVDAEYTVVLEEVAEMPAAAEFGKLHEAGVTAWDALVTNDEALEKEVAVFDDIQNYVLADLDGNGKIEAIDALNINKISLFQGAVVVPTWVDAE